MNIYILILHLQEKTRDEEDVNVDDDELEYLDPSVCTLCLADQD